MKILDFKKDEECFHEEFWTGQMNELFGNLTEQPDSFVCSEGHIYDFNTGEQICQ